MCLFRVSPYKSHQTHNSELKSINHPSVKSNLPLTVSSSSLTKKHNQTVEQVANANHNIKNQDTAHNMVVSPVNTSSHKISSVLSDSNISIHVGQNQLTHIEQPQVLPVGHSPKPSHVSNTFQSISSTLTCPVTTTLNFRSLESTIYFSFKEPQNNENTSTFSQNQFTQSTNSLFTSFQT